MFELWDRRDDLVKTFSGGMKRRLEIARGLLHTPKVLFLDEPTLGLDPQSRNQMWTHVRNLRATEGVTVFLTTHYMDEADRDAVGHAIRFVHVVGGEEHGHALGGPEVAHVRPHLIAALRIEAERRLVEKQYLRRVQQPTGDLEAAFHAAGERLHQVIAPLVQFEHPQQHFTPRPPGVPRHVVQHPVDVHVLPRRELAVETRIMEDDAEPLADFRRMHGDVESVELERARRRAQQGGEHLDGSGLAGAIRPQERENLPGSDVEGDVVDGQDGAERLDDMLDAEDRAIAHLRPRRRRFGGVDELVVVPHGQVCGCLLVDDHDRITMQLDGTGRHHAGDRSFDGLGNRLGLGLPARHQDQLARIEDGPNAHGDRIDRHTLSALEEPGVIVDSLFGQRLEPRPGAQGAARLVECDVAIRADAQDLQVDTAAFRDALLVPLAEGGVVAGRARGNVDVVTRDVHVLEEVLVHEVVVALGVIHGQAHVFVEVERRHPREVELLLLVQPHQLLIEAEWRGSGGHAEHGIRLGVEYFDDDLCRRLAHLLVVSLNDDFHREPPAEVGVMRLPSTLPSHVSFQYRNPQYLMLTKTGSGDVSFVAPVKAQFTLFKEARR